LYQVVLKKLGCSNCVFEHNNLEIYLEAINYLFSNIQGIANLNLLKEPSKEERFHMFYHE
jgi:hypothetical protein